MTPCRLLSLCPPLSRCYLLAWVAWAFSHVGAAKRPDHPERRIRKQIYNIPGGAIRHAR
jgi:hypothetical protein